MSGFKRKLRIAAAVVVVLLLAAGGWVYYTIYMGSDFALRHAESFLFRRMTVSKLEDKGQYRFFFVTNRQEAAGHGTLEERFGRAQGTRLHFGSFDTEIEPSLGLGMLINPTEWFQNEEIRLLQVRDLDQSAMLAEIRDMVAASPLNKLVVVVHGFREAFPSALRKTAFLGHVLDIDAPVLVFDWPGNQGATPVGYRRAREAAVASAADLAVTIDMIVREIGPTRLSLLANSLGGQVVADAFALLYDEPEWSDEAAELDDVVLTAPDVGREEFEQRFRPMIAALSRKLTVYVSSNDRALQISRLLNRSTRRGESTLTPGRLEGSTNIAAEADREDERVTVVDVTPVNRTRNFHNFSLETPEFFDDLFLRLTNNDTPRSRRLYRIQTPDGIDYWVLTRGR